MHYDLRIMADIENGIAGKKRRCRVKFVDTVAMVTRAVIGCVVSSRMILMHVLVKHCYGELSIIASQAAVNAFCE